MTGRVGSQSEQVACSAGVVSGAILVSRITGLAREMVMANKFGARLLLMTLAIASVHFVMSRYLSATRRGYWGDLAVCLPPRFARFGDCSMRLRYPRD